MATAYFTAADMERLPQYNQELLIIHTADFIWRHITEINEPMSAKAEQAEKGASYDA